jgi:geranylgeranyl diphosphate synthase type I
MPSTASPDHSERNDPIPAAPPGRCLDEARGAPLDEKDRWHRQVNHSGCEEFVALVRSRVDAKLASWLEARVLECRARGPEVEALGEAIQKLVLRGGKRMRAVVLAASFVACGGEVEHPALEWAGASMELLQAYLLVHDDWMDGDDVRRGGPSVPAAMRRRFGVGPVADAASILAGDLASAWAQSLLLEMPMDPTRVVLAARELARVQDEVVSGQMIDVGGGAREIAQVEAAYALKTASYTVTRPVAIGARLAGAPESLLVALRAFAEPLGVAFQLRDDVLGVFGNSHTTGKPSGSDLREGKRTALVAHALQDAAAARALAPVLGRADAPAQDVASAARSLEECGALRRVDERIVELAGTARLALGRADVTARGRALLGGIISLLTERER